MSKECKIIDMIDAIKPQAIIQTLCGKFLIGIEGQSIFKYCFETKQKVRIAGSVLQWGHKDGTRDETRFFSPQNLTLSKDLKTLFVADKGNHIIRAICVQTGVTTTFAGQVGVGYCKHVDGPKEKACFDFPNSLKLSPNGNALLVADLDKLRTICIATGQVDTIVTIEETIQGFTLSPDGKHIFICHWSQVLKFDFETCKSEIILEGKGFIGCDISKDGQILFILNFINRYIKVVNIATNELIDTITTSFEPYNMSISKCGKKLYIFNRPNDIIQVLDISKYCTNFKTFLQLQLSKHSFLSRLLVKRIN